MKTSWSLPRAFWPSVIATRDHGKNIRGCQRRLNKESKVKMIAGFIELPNNA